MRRRILWSLFAVAALASPLGCKSRGSDQDSRAAADAASMPSNVRAALEALCEAAGSTADPAMRASCSASASPREGATEEVMLRLRDDEAGVFLYYPTGAAYDAVLARDAGHPDPVSSCKKARVVWRLYGTKVPSTMTAPAIAAVAAACDKTPALP